MTDNQVEMLSTQEIADRMGVCKRTVLRWIERGLLPAYRIGVVTRVRLADFSAFLQEHRIGDGDAAQSTSPSCDG